MALLTELQPSTVVPVTVTTSEAFKVIDGVVAPLLHKYVAAPAALIVTDPP